MEFALILPVLLLLLVMTIDFGRALYGWVVLQNSARIAANFAGLNPDGWRNNIASVKTRYAAEITSDLSAANCVSFGSGGGSGTPPDPVFVDGPDAAVGGGPPDTNYDVGDIARVRLTCVFHPITPIISAILGNNIQLGASSEFRIRSGTVTGFANATAIPPPATPTPTPTATPVVTPTPTATPCVAPVANFSGTPLAGSTPLSVTFTDSSSTSSSCPITAWLWTFGDGTTSTLPNPVHSFVRTSSGNSTQKFDVSLKVTTSAGTNTKSVNNYVAVSP